MKTVSSPVPPLLEKRRLLQLETLYDLSLALQAHRPEPDLVEELLQRVCAALDPAAATAITRDPHGEAKAVASVGWLENRPDPGNLLRGPIWRDLVAAGETIRRREGEIAGRPFRELLATPLSYRGVFVGFLAVMDKEARGGGDPAFSEADRRFLESVAALAAVAIDSARQVESLESERERLAEENFALRGRVSEEVEGQRIVAHAPAMREALERVERLAPRGVSVLVRGESGTGKELIAKLLHLRSGRSGALIALNCAAIPESLLESELFGIEKGVATGVEARRGKFELADGGTLFLDEIGDMQPALQAKLLRALQEREVTRLGGRQTIPVDVRLIAATHQDLEKKVAAGSFREDLYYRLKGVEIQLPPLRDRRQDIPALVRQFAESFCHREGLPVPAFRPEALGMLMSHNFPGNVRELENTVEAAVSLADGTVTADLLASLLGASREQGGEEKDLDLAQAERRHIERVLRLTGGNKSRAADLLGINRRTLQRKGF